MISENNSRVPRLRFPGFTGEWVEKTLSDVCVRITEKVGNKVLEPISISAGNGIISQKERFGRDISGVQYKNYIHIRKGDYCYNKGNSKQFPQGCIYELTKFEEAAAPNAFISFRFNDVVCPQFFNGYFESNAHGWQLAQYITSGARADGLLNLNAEDFFKIKFFIPPTIEEQKMIAECLAEMDKMIAAQGENVAALKEKKKGLMQQLFPQDGETTPRLRFPGFEGDWEEKKLSDFGSIITGGTPSRQEENYWHGDFCWVSAQDMKEKYVFDSKEKVTEEGKKHCRVLPKNSVLVTCIASIGLNAITKVDCATNQQINAVIVDNEDHAEFLYQLMEINSSRLKAMAGQTAVPIINKQQFANFSVLVPHTDSEQQKIVECLSALDDQIAAESAKLEALKDHKKGLMQQLFPQPAK